MSVNELYTKVSLLPGKLPDVKLIHGQVPHLQVSDQPVLNSVQNSV